MRTTAQLNLSPQLRGICISICICDGVGATSCRTETSHQGLSSKQLRIVCGMLLGHGNLLGIFMSCLFFRPSWRNQHPTTMKSKTFWAQEQPLAELKWCKMYGRRQRLNTNVTSSPPFFTKLSTFSNHGYKLPNLGLEPPNLGKKIKNIPVVSHPPLRRPYWSDLGDDFALKKQHFPLRLSPKMSQHAAPATKSQSTFSTNTAPATKTHTPPSPLTAPATKNAVYSSLLYSLLASILSWHLFSLRIYSLYASILSWHLFSLLASILSWHLFSLGI